MIPGAGTQVAALKPETQFLLYQRADGKVVLVVPLFSPTMRFALQPANDQLKLVGETADAFTVSHGGLAAYVAVEAGTTLWGGNHPDESLPGILLSVASLLLMPAIAWGKFRAAAALSSASLRAEAKETLACAYLSFALLLGLTANALAGWWWADPVAALLMVPWLVKEGLEGLRGEDCHDCP